MTQLRVLVSGGGTGGGVYPALAILAALRNLTPQKPSPDSPPLARGGVGGGVEILWLGSATGPERDLVTREGIPFRAVASAPIAGMGWRIVLAPFKIGWGLLHSVSIVLWFRPHALLITGGWVTIPPALACWLLRVPVMIYCPDIEPGGTINVLKRIAVKVGIVSPEARRFYRDDQIVAAGYPVRAELLDAAARVRPQQARQRFDLADKEPVLLVFGGSSGARSLNRAIVDRLPEILEDWQALHITGRLDAAWVQEAASRLPDKLAKRYHGLEYLHSEDMALALSAADLVVSRSGASALGEFPLFGLPAILVPYPHAWRTQKINADWLASQGAAIRLDDGKLLDDLAPSLARLRRERAERERMAKASAALARPDSAAKLASALLALADRRGL